MYGIIYKANRIVFMTSDNRDSLNAKFEKANAFLDNHLPDCGIDEKRYYGDEITDYDSFLKANPQFENYQRQSIEQFCKELAQLLAY